ncbi:precorrin-2 dehydrogenase/sirohydrochlorin ferrochelatase family protein [Terriglobus albidus]|uniref:precorrin-2 dehydrogenase/sirohydrochlorin ferrochelatase family protein n=1 Tax=Terriglobus albidus TaxID=1592106 RepID=UPI0021E0769E|nr:bifunctional precorrin-2 dehydrogenase/sirohydrochlorin ferrochelatase [Terriglobus albidus]
MSSLFPMFLKLDGRRCLVVGAGRIADGKAEGLLRAGADVTVIAPEANESVRALAAAGSVSWHEREVRAGDTAGFFLVVAGTNIAAVNRAVVDEARAANILVNAVDDPPYCDFYYGSIVERGDLQIAISTAGESPALAQRLRKEIDAQLPPDTGEWLAEVGKLRREVIEMEPVANDERKWILHQLAQRETCRKDDCPSRTMAREHAAEVTRK